MKIDRTDKEDTITNEKVATYRVELLPHEMSRLSDGHEITFVIKGCIVTIAKAGPVGPRGPA